MNDNLFEKAYDPEQFRENGHRLIDMLADYMKACLDNEEMPVLPWKEPADQEKYWRGVFNSSGKFSIEDFFKDYLEKSNHIHHPHYAGHQVVPPLPLTALANLIEAFTNNGMAVYEMGPASSAMEKVVIDWLLGFWGWQIEGGGMLTSGGSLGNLTAMLAARQSYKEMDVWENGIRNGLAVMVSSESHYSIERAVKIMGLGEKGVIRIPVDDHFRIQVNRLQDILDDAVEKGISVFAVVGNACSTSTGKYDDLAALGEFCRKNKIWFHVDAAHGGPAIFSEKYKHLVNGIEMADSAVIDFHKMMLVPALTTAVLYKDKKNPFEAFTQKARYLLQDKGELNWWDSAGRTIECTKKPMSVKVFMMIKMFGAGLIEKFVDKTYDLARDFAGEIDATDDFELAVQPDSNIVCFRYKPITPGSVDLDELNSNIRDELKNNGEYYLVQTNINDEIFMRASFMNPFTDIGMMRDMLGQIREIAKLEMN